MTKIMTVLFFGLVFNPMLAAAQLSQRDSLKINEPEFEGQVLLVLNNGAEGVLLAEQKNSQTRTKGSVYTTIKSVNVVDGATSSVEAYENRNIKIIVRNKTNDLTPASVINIFRLESDLKKNTRSIVNGSSGAFTGMEYSIDFIQFTGKKFGRSSYILEIPVPLEPGEYALTLESSRNVFNMFSIKSIK